MPLKYCSSTAIRAVLLRVSGVFADPQSVVVEVVKVTAAVGGVRMRMRMMMRRRSGRCGEGGGGGRGGEDGGA